MSSRKSPIYPAKMYAKGTISIGLDGNRWIVSVDINKRKRWIPYCTCPYPSGLYTKAGQLRRDKKSIREIRRIRKNYGCRIYNNQYGGDRFQRQPGNYFIHGTNSGIFDLLPFTDMQILDPIEMIEKYSVVPLGGEIVQGGFIHVNSRQPTSFGLVFPYTTFIPDRSFQQSFYGLKEVITYSMLPTVVDKKQLKKDLYWNMRIDEDSLCTNINIVLIYYVRCRELGMKINNEIVHQYINHARKISNRQLLLTEFGKTIFRIPDQVPPGMTKYDFYDRLYDEIFDRVKKGQNILDGIFSRIPIPIIGDSEFGSDGISKAGAVLRSTDEITGFILNFYKDNYNQKYLDSFRKKLLEYNGEFQLRINLLQSLLNRNIPTIMPDPLIIPIILICDDESIMNLFARGSKFEYRAKRPLKIGVDITRIAVKDNVDPEILQQKLNRLNLRGISIVSFEDLAVIFHQLKSGYQNTS